MERVVAGEVANPEAEILDEIDTWNVAKEFVTLPFFLGMTPAEYKAWVENRSSILQLVEQRKAIP
jgi:hypothetical protein